MFLFRHSHVCLLKSKFRDKIPEMKRYQIIFHTHITNKASDVDVQQSYTPGQRAWKNGQQVHLQKLFMNQMTFAIISKSTV